MIGGPAQRGGRFEVGRFCTATAAFGTLGLDLRAAVPSQDEITLTVGIFGIAVNTGGR